MTCMGFSTLELKHLDYGKILIIHSKLSWLQQQPLRPIPVMLDRRYITISPFRSEDDSPYGKSMFTDCPFMAELMMEQVHATKLNWIRIGAPSFAILFGIPKDIDASVDVSKLAGDLVSQAKADWSDAMTKPIRPARSKISFRWASDMEDRPLLAQTEKCSISRFRIGRLQSRLLA